MMARDIPKPAGQSGVTALEGPPWMRTTMGCFLPGSRLPDGACRDSEKVPAMKSFVAHQSFDECDRLAITRPAWNRDLKRSFVDGRGVTVCDVDRVNLSDPPIVVARSRCRRCDERLVVGGPIVIVDVEILRRNLAQLPIGDIENCDPLVMNCGVDHAGRRRRGHEWAAATRAFDIEKGNLFAIMRPTGPRSVSIEVGKLFGIGTIGFHTPELALRSLSGARKNRERLGIGGPRGIEIGPFAADRNFD